MALSFNELRSRLIHKILSADSPEKLKRYCDAIMKGIEKSKINGHIVIRFIDKTLIELESIDVLSKDENHKNNIRIAETHLNRVKQLLSK